MKRTALLRKTPLARGTAQLARTRLKANPASLSAGVPAETRQAVMERASGRCELCYVEQATDVHHRFARGSHGRIETVDALLALCRLRHAAVHSPSPAQARRAYDAGWLLRHGDPDTTPFVSMTAWSLGYRVVDGLVTR